VSASRRTPLTQARWLSLPGAHPDAACLRADAYANMLAVARAVGWSADWETLRSRPTIARIMAVTGLSKRSCQRWCRWLELRGLLRVLEEGTTPQYRPGVLRRGDANLARTWELADPSVDGTGTPSGSLVSCPRSTPRAAFPQPKKLSDEGRRRESARFLRAGWQMADIHFATSHTPDGTRWAFSDPPRWPRAHLRWRLSWWLGPDGSPLPSPSQQRAARFVARMAGQERRRAERKAGTAPPPEWHHARAAMRLRATVRSTPDPRRTP
jgi:hypothetical protein